MGVQFHQSNSSQSKNERSHSIWHEGAIMYPAIARCQFLDNLTVLAIFQEERNARDLDGCFVRFRLERWRYRIPRHVEGG